MFSSSLGKSEILYMEIKNFQEKSQLCGCGGGGGEGLPKYFLSVFELIFSTQSYEDPKEAANR